MRTQKNKLSLDKSHITSKNKRKHRIKIRSKKQKGGTIDFELIEAAQNNDVKRVTELINENVDVNMKDEVGRTALMEASICDPELLDEPASYGQEVMENKKKIIKLLIEKGANWKMKDNANDTALDLAKAFNYPYDDKDCYTCEDIIKLLEEYNEREKDKQNLAVIQAATRKGNTKMPSSEKKLLSMTPGQGPNIGDWLGGKRKTKKSKKSKRKMRKTRRKRQRR